MNKPDYVILLAALDEYLNQNEKIYSNMTEIPNFVYTPDDETQNRNMIERKKNEKNRINRFLEVKK